MDLSRFSINSEALIVFSLLMLVGYLLVKQLFCVFSLQFKKGKVRVTKGSVPPTSWRPASALPIKPISKARCLPIKPAWGCNCRSRPTSRRS